VADDSFTCHVERCAVECGWYGGEESGEEEYSGSEVYCPESTTTEREEEQVDQTEEDGNSEGCPEQRVTVASLQGVCE